MISAELKEIILAKARLVIAGYPTFGVTLDDLASITVELCEDDHVHISAKTALSVILHSELVQRKRRYYPNSSGSSTGTGVKIAATPFSDEKRVTTQAGPKTPQNADWRTWVYGGARRPR